jgi:hypothetical protein
VALEKAKESKQAHGEFESECPGYCGVQDAFYVGTLNQQTFIDTYNKVAFAKLYGQDSDHSADLLNDRVLPFFEEHEIALSRVLSNRGTQYCGADGHDVSCPWQWKISTTPGPRPRVPRLMGFVSAFTRRCSMSSTG